MTEKQKIFADEYLLDLNATRAYKASYPRCKKDETAAASGARLLKNPEVSSYIKKRMEDREKRLEIRQDDVIRELARIGFADITDYLDYREEKTTIKDKDGKPVVDCRMVISVRDSNEIDGAAVSEINVASNGSFKFKLYNKLEALEKLAKHLNLYSENDHSENEKKMRLLQEVFGEIKNGS